MRMIGGIGRGTDFSRHIDHWRRRLRGRGGLAVVRRRFAHRLPRAGKLAKARRVFDVLPRLGVPRRHQLQFQSQRAGAAGGLSGRRHRVGRHAADVQRRGRQHRPLDRACAAFPPLRLPGAQPGRRRRRLAPVICRPGALLRSQRPVDGLLGHCRRSRQSAARAAAHAVPAARAGRRAAGARLRQPGLALVAVGLLHQFGALPRAGSLQQLRSQWPRLHRGGQGIDRCDLLAGGDRQRRGAAHRRAGVRGHHRFRRTGHGRALFRRRRQRPVPAGAPGGRCRQRDRHAAPAAALEKRAPSPAASPMRAGWSAAT